MLFYEVMDGDLSYERLYKKYDTDAGTDITSNVNIIIKAGSDAVVSTGIKIMIPTGTACLLWPRSGLSVKNKIEVGAGCVDSSYRGEVKVHLYNFGTEDFVINKGDRIAQMLVLPVDLTRFIRLDNLDDGERGDNGFGSTGK